MSEVLPDPAAVKKAEREIAEFRRFEELRQTLVEVSQKICRLRPVESTPGHWTAEEKNGCCNPSGDYAGSRVTPGGGSWGAAQNR